MKRSAKVDKRKRALMIAAAVTLACGAPIWSVLSASAQTPSTASAAANEAYADLAGMHLWVKDSGGSGQAIVLMHAATGSSQVWEHQYPALTAAGYRVIAYDRRGFGRTRVDPSIPAGTGADDLNALIDHLKIDRFHLVSTAAGGMVALDYALSFPERLRSLVVANTMGMVQDETLAEFGRRIRPPQFDSLPPEFRELSPSYRAANPEGTRRWIELARTNRPEGAAPVGQRYKNQGTLALLDTLRVPTLFITGESDFYMPPPVMHAMASHVARAESIVIPETAHSAFWEQPDVFNRQVLMFLAKH